MATWEKEGSKGQEKPMMSFVNAPNACGDVRVENSPSERYLSNLF